MSKIIADTQQGTVDEAFDGSERSIQSSKHSDSDSDGDITEQEEVDVSQTGTSSSYEHVNLEEKSDSEDEEEACEEKSEGSTVPDEQSDESEEEIEISASLENERIEDKPFIRPTAQNLNENSCTKQISRQVVTCLQSGVRQIKTLPKTLTTLYIIGMLLEIVFGTLLFADVDSTRGETWIVCFGVTTLILLVIAALLLVEPPELVAEVGNVSLESSERARFNARTCFSKQLGNISEILQYNHNANKFFVIVEAVFDLVLAGIGIQESDSIGQHEYLLALSALIAAAVALTFGILDVTVLRLYREELNILSEFWSTEPLWDTVRAEEEATSREFLQQEEEATETEEEALEMAGVDFEVDSTAYYLAAIQKINRPVFRWFVHPVFNYAFPLALVLSDLADILLLSRTIAVANFEAKDMLLFIFLLSNVLISEIFAGVASLFESLATRQPVLDDDDETRRQWSDSANPKTLRAQFAAASLRASLNRKANVQNLITGLFVIPLVVAITLFAASIVTSEELLVLLLPFIVLACVSGLLEGWDLCGLSETLMTKASGFMIAYVRVLPLAPRFLAGIWALILGHTGVITVENGFDENMKRLLFDLYAAYILTPLCIRVCCDMVRCLGLIFMLRKSGDFGARRLTETDYLSIGRYGSSVFAGTDKGADGCQIVLSYSNPTRMSLRLLFHGLSVWNKSGDGPKIRLKLEYCAIGPSGCRAFARSLSKNSTVEHLSLDENGVGSDGACALASALRVNTTLRFLSLRDCKIDASGVQAMGRTLEENLSGLEKLDLSENDIQLDGVKAISQALKVSSLKELSLSSTHLASQGATKIGEGLCQNRSLTILVLKSNEIRAGTEALGRALETSALRELNLSLNHIDEDSVKALGTGLSKSNTLTKIDLSHNEIGPRGAMHLLGTHAGRVNTSLLDLDLTYAALGAEGARCLAEWLKQRVILENLGLTSNNIGDDGATAIGDSLKSCSAIRVLNLRANNITDAGVYEIVKGLKCNETLRELDLGANHIEADGAKHIADWLTCNRSLEKLTIAEKLGPLGTRHIAEALKKASVLNWLDLSNNDMESQGAVVLAAALRVNHVLKVLLLRNNGIGPPGAEHLAQALKANHTLEELILSRNSIEDSGALAFFKVLSEIEGTALKYIDVESNMISRDLMDQLQEKRLLLY